MALIAIATYAQSGSVRGRILEESTGEAAIGANVLVDGTSIGATTNLNGEFTIGGVPTGKQTLKISYIGFEDQMIDVTITNGGTAEVGTVSLKSSVIGLNEIQVVASIAVDRQTPVAVSKIKAEFIEEKLGSQEFPEILKTTPGVYATKTGGGWGDSRINLRGFNSVNVAVMINGVPVNDMENGRVYWSNWAGLADVTSSMQVQRGLGASKVAVPSVGGTINIVTKTTDAEAGGNVYMATGNNGYSKAAFALSTGLMENNMAVTISGARTQGNGWVDGTSFLGHSYFFNVSKIINDNHQLSLTGFGAPQRHGQRQTQWSDIRDPYNNPRGLRYNPDWGYLDGQEVQVEDNFYHKPQFSLNHYWDISPSTELSTAVYASFGTGGGGGKGSNWIEPRTGGVGSPIDLDAIVANNQELVANGQFEDVTFLRASRNDHTWYGMLSTLNTDVNENLTITAGVDLRYYVGRHFREITNLLGAPYIVDDSDNDQVQLLQVGDKYSYNNDGIVRWGGLFGQAEYNIGRLATFLSASTVMTQYSRVDYFNYTADDPLRQVGFFNFPGFQLKGGGNFNLNDNHNVFANVGGFSKAPAFDAIFPRFNNEDVNDAALNEKIFSVELGYGFRSRTFNANLNLYRTNWNDRTYQFFAGSDQEGNPLFANLRGVDALHQGIEFDGVWQPIKALKVTGMLSVGDWTWQNNLENVQVLDDDQNVIATADAYIAGLKVGDAAQTNAAFGIQYELLKGLFVSGDVTYDANMYASFNPTNRGAATLIDGEDLYQAWRAPAFTLVDIQARYNFNLGGFDATLFGTVNNLLDEAFISDANEGAIDWAGGARPGAINSTMYYGVGRQWNLALKIKF